MPTRGRLIPALFILIITAAALYVVWPANPRGVVPGYGVIPWPSGKGVTIGSFVRDRMRLGLDLQGGTRLLLQASLPQGTEGSIADAMPGTISVLTKRVDSSGVAEAEIAQQGASNISVQLPGMTPEQARKLLGRTALLQFCERAPGANPANAQPCDEQGQWVQATGNLNGTIVPLTSRYLKANAQVSTDQIGQPLVLFEWVGDGPELSKQITERLMGQPLGIFLDTELLASPTVQGVIEQNGSISGMPLASQGDRTGARDLVVQLNSGALPVQLTVLQEQNVDATLGADAVQRSILAGEIGMLIVILFMTLYYRVPGMVASAALLVYALITLAVFKLVPVTLTLAGIGAFVLSVGMAVDANILVFERMKEEMRDGRSFTNALEAGFARAWPSIRDSNVSTLITTLILFVLGGGITIPGLGSFEAPLVRGFAVTLALGVFISMFSSLFVTRTLLRLLLGTPIARNAELLGANLRPMHDVGTRGLRATGGE